MAKRSALHDRTEDGDRVKVYKVENYGRSADDVCQRSQKRYKLRVYLIYAVTALSRRQDNAVTV